MQERDALVAVIDPEQRGADALGQQQAGGAADEGAEHVRDGGVAQLPFESTTDSSASATPKATLIAGSVAQRPQHERGVRHCPDKAKPREYEPGHMKARAVPREVLGNLRTAGS